MTDTSTDVIIIGAGVSGLTTSWHLHKAGVDFRLLEAGEVVGGATRTKVREGFLLEQGPFNVIIRDPAFEELVDDMADAAPVVSASKEAKKRYIYRHGQIVQVPMSPVSLLTTPLLRFSSRLRLLRGLLYSGKAGAGEETIEQAAARRFGQETADVLVSSLISGIFAGDVRKLSLRACFPGVAKVDAEASSLLAYGLSMALTKRDKTKPKRRWRGLVSIEGGLGALTHAVGERLGEELETGVRTERIERSDCGYVVHATDTDGGPRVYRARRLVLAVPVREAARLLQPLSPDAAAIASDVHSSSLVVLNLGYRREQVRHPLDGFGFLVPQVETHFPLMGVLWADSVFPHHAPSDQRLLRVFIGGARDPQAVERTDEQLLVEACGALGNVLGVSGDPTMIDICRWREAIPQYHAGHAERMARLRQLVAAQPGLHLAGNYLEGVSLNDCVRVGKAVALDVLGGAFPQVGEVRSPMTADASDSGTAGRGPSPTAMAYTADGSVSR